ncbi:MAG TPA: carbohydrate ABC transporter permease [Clostridiales bacterium]|nr:carbohydrate ABC transporter permease [Clostridiales bacterium]
MIKKSLSDQIFTAIIYIFLTLILIATIYPLIYVVSASFSNPLDLVKGNVWLFPKGFNLNAYRKVFQNEELLNGYVNSIKYTVIGTTINVVMTTMAAYPLSRKDFKGRNVLTLLFTFTLFFNGGMIPTFLIYKNTLGLYNNIWAIVLPAAVNVWNLIIMRTYFQSSIPMEIQEAAFIDGCSNIGTLTRIILPLSKPIIAVMTMYYSVAHWNAYFNALIYLKDRSRLPLQMIIRNILIVSIAGGDSGESLVDQVLLSEGIKYAVIVVASIPMLLLYPFIQKYFVKGVTMGAVKG